MNFYRFFIKKIFLLVLLCSLHSAANAQYNTLWIPDTLSGTTFNLTVRDTFRQVLPGQQTIVGAFNHFPTWGPTLFWNKGDSVNMFVTNSMLDTTTVHWHGIHLPAIMDGGPHQTIAPNQTWNPKFRVKNNAAMYWYHPHLHMMTQAQLGLGIGGLIIVRDPIEAALALPRKYGVDDIPLVLTDSRFDNSNQIVLSSYGDTMMCNFTLNAQYTIPAQVVRLRILNTASERFYNLGFSDNRSFSVIGSDGGLLNAPVSLTRKLLAPGERVEILVNCTGQNGTSFDLMAYNSGMATDYPGWQPTNYSDVRFRNDLGGRNFNILHLNVGPQTANPKTTIPTSLTTNVFPDSTASIATRAISMALGGSACPPGYPDCYQLNATNFDMNRIDYRPLINSTEIWEITNNSTLAHPFHIHDAQFKIISVNGVNAPAADRGWKDVVVVRRNYKVRFVVSFPDYADSLHPFMYHCHMAPHEDAGMMGQFTVMPECVPTITTLTPTTLGVGALATLKGTHLNNITSVKFNALSSSFNITSDTTIKATVPTGVTAGVITAQNNCGTATSQAYTIVDSANVTVKFLLQGLYVAPDSMRNAMGIYADSVQIRLYAKSDVTTPAKIINTVVRTNGQTFCKLPASFIGRQYYICIRHRNSLETWSKTAVTLRNGLTYDFSRP